MNHKRCPILHFLLPLVPFFIKTATAKLACGDCGHTPAPYPLSTSPSCGDPSYKVRCQAWTLWLDTLNGSSYMITSINPTTQRLIIRPQDFYRGTCVTTNYKFDGIWLDDNLPFSISNSNTIFSFNCSKSVAAVSAADCSPNNVCHTYIKGDAEAGARCKTTSVCCWYTTGGSKTAYRVDLDGGECTALMSFVNLDSSLPVSKWPKPGLEIEWEVPREPVCESPSDCQKLENSTCSQDPMRGGGKRCLCNAGFRWDPVNGTCSHVTCHEKKRCRHHINQKKLNRGLTFSACGILLLVLFAFLVYKHNQHIRRKAHRNLIKKRQEILNANNNGKSAKLFSDREIKRATNDFSKGNLIGSGGFGEVFKGVLDDGILTAIKRAKKVNTVGMDQVLNEVRILSQVNHRSLVRLLGCCVELEQPVLVYEYVPNGTLFDHLHGCCSTRWGTLTWRRRLLIAHQTAQGLAYLHNSAVPPIFHRDIKSSNILLNELLDAKVSDFGLSRLADSEATHISTCVQGTLGYLDPEYYQNFQLTDKSDVYSFGVVLLELLTSKRAIDFNREDEDVNLVVYVSKTANEEKLMNIVDPVLEERATQLEKETMKAIGMLAVACVDEQKQNRPSMREVLEEIKYILSILTTQVFKT